MQRKVKKATGLSLNKYLRLARLKKARLLFETGEIKTISEAAFAVGFETPAYFSKVFYQEFGKKSIEYLQ